MIGSFFNKGEITMLLSHDEIEDLLETEVVEYSEPELLNAASLDIRLGRKLLIERPEHRRYENEASMRTLNRVSLRKENKNNSLNLVAWDLLQDGPFLMYPGEFILAHSHEVFNLPNDISAEYKLKSSMARIGLEHLNAGWCDAGWHGSVLTLELKNMTRSHEIELNHLDKIGQMVFFRHRVVKQEHSYATKGRYNNDRSVSGAKPDLEANKKVLVISEGEEDGI
jgi:dCTP deaminase